MTGVVRKIFIIDDQVENLKTMVSIFDEHHPEYEVYQTNDSTKAVYLAQKIQPDLIITDWDMPVLSGIEVIQKIKEDTTIKNIPVIMATGVHISSADLQVALEAGAIDYIRKPIDITELLARTNSVLHISDLHKENIEARNQELAESSLSLVQYNRFNIGVAKKLHELSVLIESDQAAARKLLKSIISSLNSKIKEDSWQRFNLSFDRIHKNFNKNLLLKHPTLTTAEIKLCAFIRLGMSNKEIASVLNQSPDSIKVSRSRLRKKLNLTRHINFESYLIKF